MQCCFYSNNYPLRYVAITLIFWMRKPRRLYVTWARSPCLGCGAGLWASPAALGTALSGSALGGGLTSWLSQLPSTWFPRVVPVRGSQGALVTLLKTEFYFSSWKGWEDDIDCEVRGPNYFVPWLGTHPVPVPEFQPLAPVQPPLTIECFDSKHK